MIPAPTKAMRDKNPELKDQTSNSARQVREPAGYMIFLPTGQCYRLSPSELIARGFDRDPDIIGYEQANNNETPAGRFKLARSDAAKAKAYKELEEQVIFACTKGSKDMRNFVSNYDPQGQMKEAA
jgi:hypothetical protein